MVYPILGRNTLQILLVEDDHETTQSVIQLLQTLQIGSNHLTIVESLEDAINQYSSSNDFELILLDLNILRKQTFESSKKLSQELANIPLLVLCNAQDDAFLSKIIRSGIHGLLLKEILSPVTLSHAIHQVIEQTNNQKRLQKRINTLLKKGQQLEYSLDNTLLTVQQLYQHTDVLESILSASPDAVVFANTKHHICKVNPAFTKMFGYPAHTVLGQTAALFYERSDAYQDRKQQHQTLQSDDSSTVYEERYCRQNGEIFVGETVSTIVKDTAGQTLGYLDIIRDISDRKHAELALQQSETINRALLQAVPDKLIWMKRDGSYLRVKGQSLSDEQDFSTAKVYDYLPTELAQQKLHYAQHALKTGERQEYERQISHDGQLCYEDVRLVPCGEDRVLVMVRDITVRKQSEIALQESQDRYRSLYRKTPVMLHSIDAEGCLIHVSDYWLEKLSYTRHEVIGRPFTEFLTAESRHHAQTIVLPEHCQTDTCTKVPYQIVAKTGDVIDVLLSVTVEHDRSGNVIHFLAVMIDVTERNQAVAALEASEVRFQSFMDNSPTLAFMKDANSGQILYVNKPFETFFQIEAPDILGKTDFDWLPPDVAEKHHQHDCQVMYRGHPLQLSEVFPDRDGNPQNWLVFKFPCRDSENRPVIGGVAINITEQKRLERQLYEEKELAQVTLHSIGDAVITTDAEEIITYLNPIAEKLTGWEKKKAQGKHLADVFVILNEDTHEPVENSVTQALRKGTVAGLTNHTILVTKNGNERSIEDSAAPIYNSDGEIIGIVLVFHDVTEARQLSRQLTWQASHDELTQLLNRRGFEQGLSTLLRNSHETNVLCYLDLDQFKLVNDTCGHIAGDKLLQQVADILVNQVRVTDTVARLGGDEFAILLHQCSLESARRIANLVRQSIADFHFFWGEQCFSVGVSIGLVEITQDSPNLIDVLAAADSACYAAKEAGRNRIHVYRTDDLSGSRQQNQQQWCLRIDKALEDNRFQLYHQPIVAVNDANSTHRHTELLLRMIDEQGKIIAPTTFLPSAERYNRMPTIDKWVICRLLAELNHNSDNSHMFYNVNLSGASLNDEKFLIFLKDALADSGIDPAMLCFEITETAAISNLHRVTTFMDNIKPLGCQFVLDDFGSGMSSFRYLEQLPVDFIKIDGSFIQNLDSPINRAIVEAICTIGQVMNVQVIAERVENDIAKTQLQELGIDYVQGYGIIKPSPFSLGLDQ